MLFFGGDSNIEEGDQILISLAGDDTWPNQYTNSIPQHFLGAIHSVRTHLMTNFSTPWMNPFHSPSCVRT